MFDNNISTGTMYYVHIFSVLIIMHGDSFFISQSESTQLITVPLKDPIKKTVFFSVQSPHYLGKLSQG